MPDRLALDTNAAVDYFRASRREPPQLAAAQEVFLPLPVLGELYAGAFGSERTEENLAAVEQAVSLWTLLIPDALTARLYGRLAARFGSDQPSARTERARRNDLWTAALCLQHQLALLTNDRDFDGLEELKVLHW